MLYRINFTLIKNKIQRNKLIVIFFAIIMMNASLALTIFITNPNDNNSNSTSIDETIRENSNEILFTSSRSNRALSFTEISTGLPGSGDYNFIAFGDFNKDNEIDFATGAEDYGAANTEGLKAYTGNGGTSWSDTSTGLLTTNSWGGLALEDADADGDLELYATDEKWGTSNNLGVQVWEFQSGSWSNSGSVVSTPAATGEPDNVLLTDITGDNKLDLVLCTQSGIEYYQNDGGNPVAWTEISTGLPTSAEYTAVAVADMNKDGLKDIIASDYSGGEHLFVQQSSGDLWAEHSTGISQSGNVMGISVGDVNEDSHMDIIFGRRDNGLSCLLGNSGGGSGGTTFTWTEASTNLPTNARYCQIQLVDIDLDNDLDIIAPDATGGNGVQIFLGNGNNNPGMSMTWTLATNTNLPSSGSWYGANCYDINKDGSLDIVAASWGSGLTAYLNDLTASLDNTAPGAIGDLGLMDATNNSISINWTAPADNGTDTGSGPVQEYDIRYLTSTINAGNWASAIQCTGEPIPAVPGTEQNFTITGLDPVTTYYIALRSSDEKPNISPLSNVVFDSTSGTFDTVRPGKIYDLQAIDPTTTTINLTWTAPPDDWNDLASGATTGYDIRYDSSEITNISWDTATIITQSITPASIGTTENFTVTGLLPATTYYFAIKAVDERSNWGLISNSVFNTTLSTGDSTPPTTIQDLTVSNPTINTLDLSWSAPADDTASGNVKQYDIRFALFNITESNWDSAINVSNVPPPRSAGEQETFKVTALSSNMTYYFAIRSCDEVPNWSLISNSASGTTLDTSNEQINVTITPEDTTLESGEGTNILVYVRTQLSFVPVQGAHVDFSADHNGVTLSITYGETNSQGLITLHIDAPSVTMETEITIYVNVSNFDYSNAVKSNIKILVMPPSISKISFNLLVVNGQVTFSKSNIQDGDEIMISAEIINDGPDMAPDFFVSVSIDGNQIDEYNHPPGLLNAEKFLLDIIWIATEGEHIVTFEILTMDPNNESDISDNSVQKTFPVSKKIDEKDDSNDSKGLGSWLWIILIVIIVVILLLVLLFITRSKRSNDQNPATGRINENDEGNVESDIDQAYVDQTEVDPQTTPQAVPQTQEENASPVPEDTDLLESPDTTTIRESEPAAEEQFEEEFIPDPGQESSLEEATTVTIPEINPASESNEQLLSETNIEDSNEVTASTDPVSETLSTQESLPSSETPSTSTSTGLEPSQTNNQQGEISAEQKNNETQKQQKEEE